MLTDARGPYQLRQSRCILAGRQAASVGIKRQTGAAVKTIEFDAVVRAPSFSDDGTFLHTDRGLLHTSFLSNSATIPPPNLLRSIFVKEQWVSQAMENILWLPSEYRPSCVAVHENLVEFGCEIGRVLIMEFAL